MVTVNTQINLRGAWRLGLHVVLVLLAAAVTAVQSTSVSAATATPASQNAAQIRTWKIHYTAFNGIDRLAYVILPASYGPGNNPPLPLVISPHGRGGNGRVNAQYWGNLPALGGFAVVNPDGMGRRIPNFSFAYPGQIDDLARMPEFVTKALPWLRIDHRRIYVLGSSMGGQETLMLVARHPHLLAGAAAMDSVTDVVRRYEQMPDIPNGLVLQASLVDEVGSTPAENASEWAARSPLAHANEIAFSGVPLQIWWSRNDKVVTDQAHQSGTLFATLRSLNSHAPVSAYIGAWKHSHEMRYTELLPIALAGFGLLSAQPGALPATVTYVPAPSF
jgi:poly(3-hydroxybutyrate) depolymerase